MTNEVEILYVEDDAAEVELTLIALKEFGLANAIHVARDGVEALDFLLFRGSHANRPGYVPKFVLLDLKLPKVSGLEVLKAIRSNDSTRTIPVVVLTSSKEQKDLLESYELGVNSYVQKPVDFIQFRQAVRQLGTYWLVVNQPPPLQAGPIG